MSSSKAFRKTRPSYEVTYVDYMPREQVVKEISTTISKLRGEKYKFKLVLCRQPGESKRVEGYF